MKSHTPGRISTPGIRTPLSAENSPVVTHQRTLLPVGTGSSKLLATCACAARKRSGLRMAIGDIMA